MTTLSDIYQKTKQLLEENADTNSEIDTKLHFSSYIRDSIQFIKIVICLEDEYDLEFDNQDLQLEMCIRDRLRYFIFAEEGV